MQRCFSQAHPKVLLQDGCDSGDSGKSKATRESRVAFILNLSEIYVLQNVYAQFVGEAVPPTPQV